MQRPGSWRRGRSASRAGLKGPFALRRQVDLPCWPLSEIKARVSAARRGAVVRWRTARLAHRQQLQLTHNFAGCKWSLLPASKRKDLGRRSQTVLGPRYFAQRSKVAFHELSLHSRVFKGRLLAMCLGRPGCSMRVTDQREMSRTFARVKQHLTVHLIHQVSASQG